MKIEPQYPGQDFYSDVGFQTFFSSFWTQIFVDHNAIYGMADADSAQLIQIYQSFIDNINRLSAKTIPVFQTEDLVALTLNESQLLDGFDELKYGDGSVYGPQPPGGKFTEGATFQYGGRVTLSNLFYFSVPSEIKKTGSVILNRLYNPSVSLVRDVDFIIPENGVIAFKENPFNNPLMPIRIVSGENGVQERQIVVWLTKCSVENQNIYTQYGYLFSAEKSSSEFYKTLVEKFFLLFSDGPSRGVLDSFVAAAAGQPVIIEPRETVLEITPFRDDVLIVTNLSVYKVPATSPLRAYVIVGAELLAGQPLTLVTQVDDRASNTNWYSTILGMSLGRDYVQADVSGLLGFLNQVSVVQYKGEALEGRDSSGLAEFYLAGTSTDLRRFWDFVREKSIESNQFLAPALWRAAGAAGPALADDGLPLPNYLDTVTINPLQFVVENFVGNNMIFVSIDFTKIVQVGSLFSSLKFLRQGIPAHTAIVVFINLPMEDQVVFTPTPPGNVGLDLQDVTNLINFTPENFGSPTKSYWLDGDNQPIDQNAEAIAIDVGLTMLPETFDLSSAANAVESIQIKFEKAC